MSNRSSRIHSHNKNVVSYIRTRWPNDSAHIGIGFGSFADFSRLSGAVDETLIPIESPRSNEEDYVDHGQHSINAMVVFSPNHEFFYASTRPSVLYMTAVGCEEVHCSKNGK